MRTEAKLFGIEHTGLEAEQKMTFPPQNNCKTTQIARSFDKAAANYMNYAYSDTGQSLQQQVATILLKKCLGHPNLAQLNLLDVGCGPGAQSAALSQVVSNYLGLDLSFQMLKKAQQNSLFSSKKERFLGTPTRVSQPQWVQGNAQYLPFKSKSFDFIYSNLALQWCVDLAELTRELYRVLKPSTQAPNLCFSTLVQGGFTPLNALYKQGLVPQRNKYPSLEAWQSYLKQAGFVLINATPIQVNTYYETGMDLLQSFKQVGACVINHPKSASKGLRTQAWLKEVELVLENFREELVDTSSTQRPMIKMPYHVVIFEACKE